MHYCTAPASCFDTASLFSIPIANKHGFSLLSESLLYSVQRVILIWKFLRLVQKETGTTKKYVVDWYWKCLCFTIKPDLCCFLEKVGYSLSGVSVLSALRRKLHIAFCSDLINYISSSNSMFLLLCTVFQTDVHNNAHRETHTHWTVKVKLKA